ncbi:hypothetical protein EXM22_11570 [Oceanispirochaeta crateris]|uniref:Outer membrane protein beta-barrel domain-containing protein n=1 Tax=Oceanispirochaeta crateris TaxID=2518645 RepID=A0A5C1QR45_9SPIO|nr:hypothetical protein [Oceanispirochaeta crateris]QEN08592.1 hypothetical protein EXM22_11570 [Oceanispirochaeta crateris]
MKQSNYLLILILLFSVSPLMAQETEDPELEAYKQMQEDYAQTGFELFLYYPMSLHLPGWSYSEVKYSLGPAYIELPGPNVSFSGFGAGIEFDFGSRKPIVKNMGFGGNLEISRIADWNMKSGVEMDLVLSYLYLFYKTDLNKFLNYTVRGGVGIGRAQNGEALFTYPEEIEDPAGPLYSLEGAIIFPEVKRFRFQAGFAYRYLAINTKNMHILSPTIRGGFRF